MEIIIVFIFMGLMIGITGTMLTKQEVEEKKEPTNVIQNKETYNHINTTGNLNSIQNKENELKNIDISFNFDNISKITTKELTKLFNKYKKLEMSKLTFLFLQYHPNPQIVKIVEKNVNKIKINNSNVLVNHQGYPILVVLCQNANVDPKLIQTLVNEGADVNSSVEGHTPLSMACLRDKPNKDIIKILVENGANINQTTHELTPLYIISIKDNPDLEIAEYLLDNGADANTSSHDIPLIMVLSLKNNIDLVKLLIKYGAEITEDMLKSLYQAIGVNKIFKFLVKANLNMEIRKDIMRLPVFYCGYEMFFPDINMVEVMMLDISDKWLEIKECIKKYHKTLSMKWKQTNYKDDYGRIITKDWDKELSYFFEHIILSEETISKETKDTLSFCWSMSDKSKNDILQKIDEIYHEVDKESSTLRKTKHSPIIHSGIDYENYVEALLQNDGFDVSRTPTTGDQGADLVAEKNGTRIAVQCKYYSKPVGNKAVQEVIAGKDFYNCSYACVVSNNSFTPAARKIANVSNILLLNDSEIVEKLNNIAS